MVQLGVWHLRFSACAMIHEDGFSLVIADKQEQLTAIILPHACPHTQRPAMTNEPSWCTCAHVHIRVVLRPKVHFDLQLSSALLESIPGDSAKITTVHQKQVFLMPCAIYQHCPSKCSHEVWSARCFPFMLLLVHVGGRGFEYFLNITFVLSHRCIKVMAFGWKQPNQWSLKRFKLPWLSHIFLAFPLWQLANMSNTKSWKKMSITVSPGSENKSPPAAAEPKAHYLNLSCCQCKVPINKTSTPAPPPSL